MENPPPLPPPLPRQARFGDSAVERMLLPSDAPSGPSPPAISGSSRPSSSPRPSLSSSRIIAIRDIRKSRTSAYPKHGMGRAIFGLIMGLLGTAILVIILGAQFVGERR